MGSAFLSKWQGKSLADLWQVAHGQMPLNAPASLKEEQSLGIMAYILQSNGYPAGKSALQVTKLDRNISLPKGARLAAAMPSATPPSVPVQQQAAAPQPRRSSTKRTPIRASGSPTTRDTKAIAIPRLTRSTQAMPGN
jgi:hypothetical protein